MKLGVCTGFTFAEGTAQIANAAAIQAAQADYIELPLGMAAELPDAEFNALKKAVDQLGIPCLACNSAIPGHVRLVGTDYEPAVFYRYIQQAFARAGELGAKRVVIGSAGARNYPYGMDKTQAETQMLERLFAIGEAAAANGIIAVIEPLNRMESNMVNSLAEGAQMALRVQHPAVACLLDYYHMAVSGQDLSDVYQYGKLLKHTHIARTLGRNIPLCAQEEPYQAFFTALKEVGYTGNMSLEGSIGTPEEIAQSIALLRSFL